METLIQQGYFTSNALAKTIILRADVDWMRIYNYTAAKGNTNGDGVEFYWQRGMTEGLGLYWYHPAADQTVAVAEIAAGGGFYYINTSETDPSAAVAVTNSSNATASQITTGSTAGLANGDIVRLSNVVDARSICGWDFSIANVVGNTSFDMAYAMANVPGSIGTGGHWRKVPFDPIFYPRWRNIINITVAANAVITTSVPHGYHVGQKIRVNLPDDRFGMTDIHKMEATITAVSTSTITTDINSTGFNAFAFALPVSVPFTMPTVVPVGMDTGAALTVLTGAVDILSDAYYNTAYIGMKLMPGVAGPAGNTSDVMYWMAGRSFSNLVE